MISSALLLIVAVLVIILIVQGMQSDAETGDSTTSLADTTAPQIADTQSPENAVLSFQDALASSKYWAMSWKDREGTEFFAYYCFEDSGTCYLLVSAGDAIVSTGTGSFQVSVNSITFDMLVDDETSMQYTYLYDPSTSTFTQGSYRGLAYNHVMNDQFPVSVAGITIVGKFQELFNPDAEDSEDEDSYEVDAAGSGSSGNSSSGSTSSGSSSSGSSSSGSTSSSNTSSGSASSGNTSSGSSSSGSTSSSNTSSGSASSGNTSSGSTSSGSSSSGNTSSSNTSSGNTSSGSTSQAPAACSHNYANATCTAPKTCTLCGETSGAALGHTYGAATCTAPQACSTCGATTGSATGHKWKDITKTVSHEEQGHYEEVEDAKKVKKYRCPMCGYNQPTYASTDAYFSHFDSAHGSDANSSFFRDNYETVEDWVYETVKKWVVDKEAYTETVVTGRKCDVCGESESF